MKNSYSERPNGYLETIQKGLAGIRSLRGGLTGPVGTPETQGFVRDASAVLEKMLHPETPQS